MTEFSDVDSSENPTKRRKCVEVPLWLQDSDLFKQSSLAGLDLHSDLFSSNHVRENADITSFADFESVMQCIDYWGVEEWPPSVFHYIAFHISEVKAWREQTGCGIGQHVNLCDDMLAAVEKDDFDAQAAKVGSIGWLRYSYVSGHPWDDENTCSNAAGGGYLFCLQYAYDNGCPWVSNT